MHDGGQEQMRQISILLALLAVVAGSPPLVCSAWPEGVAEKLGLPVKTNGDLEVRVWLGGGVAHPFKLYRIQETNTTVSGARFVWDRLGTLPTPFTPRELRKAHARTERLIRKHFCGRSLQRAEDIVWCEIAIKNTPDWRTLLARLDPDRIRDLPPQETLGSAECFVADGTIVGIEVIKGDRYVHVTYSNPQACCPWPECRVMENVMETLEQVY